MTKKYLLSTLIVLISIFYVHVNFQHCHHQRKTLTRIKKTSQICMRKSTQNKKIGKCIKVILHMYFIIQ